MEENNSYICQTPVVLIIFNRQVETKETLGAIKKVKPKQLFVVADGPRPRVNSDVKNVNECRELLKLIDWECDVVKIFSEENLGCMQRIITGLDIVFKSVDRAIILEDDCVPSINFFRFTEWGLGAFQNEAQIGMISGSNLISNKYKTELRNGFSSLINIWGWATWRSVWSCHNKFLTIAEIQNRMGEINRRMNFSWWQSMYWRELFKYTVYAGSTWDFQLQFTFFKLKLLSVYPCKNLVNNIGFSGNGTHTNIKMPEYILNNKVDEEFDILQLPPDITKTVTNVRDNMLAHEIWHFNAVTALRLKFMNFIRLNR
jgi:hypothetical protein